MQTTQIVIESRCGLICTGCTYKESHGCGGCVNIGKPFWGDCPVKSCCEGKGFAHCGECPGIPCESLTSFSYSDNGHGDNGKRIEQCGKWRTLGG